VAEGWGEKNYLPACLEVRPPLGVLTKLWNGGLRNKAVSRYLADPHEGGGGKWTFPVDSKRGGPTWNWLSTGEEKTIGG